MEYLAVDQVTSNQALVIPEASMKWFVMAFFVVLAVFLIWYMIMRRRA